MFFLFCFGFLIRQKIHGLSIKNMLGLQKEFLYQKVLLDQNCLSEIHFVLSAHTDRDHGRFL